MEKIFSTLGFHHIAQKICNHLDAESMTNFSQTNKNILKQCNQVWLKKVQNYKSIFSFQWEKTEEKYAMAIRCLETLFDSGKLFKIPSFFDSSLEFDELLEKYLKTLISIADYAYFIRKQRAEMRELQANGILRNLETTEFYISLKTKLSKAKLIFEKYAKSIPGKIPATLKTHLLKMLHFAIRLQNIELVKTLLKPLKYYDTCIGTMTLALNIENNYDMDILKRFHQKKLFEKEDALVVEMIAKQCKNPNQHMHLVTRYDKDKQDFESALQ